MAHFVSKGKLKKPIWRKFKPDNEDYKTALLLREYIITIGLDFGKNNVYSTNIKFQQETQNISQMRESLNEINAKLKSIKKTYKLDNINKEVYEILREFSNTEVLKHIIYKLIHNEWHSNYKQEIFKDYITEKLKDDQKNLLNKFHKSINDSYDKNEELFNNAIEDAERKRKLPVREFLAKHNEFCNRFYIHIATIEQLEELKPFKSEEYDYVIFDEASQIFAEKAITAMKRGKKYIIAGDSKQLKPSNYFDSRVEIEADEFDTEQDDNMDQFNEAESLLDYYESKFNSFMLRSHYRSNHRELIEFSNFNFYDNKLIFIPQSVKYSQPIEVVDLKEGKWERKTKTNPIEADEIVKYIDNLSNIPEIYSKTLGVITFNKNQQNLIEDKLRNMNNPKIQEWMEREENETDASLFVKNIENVQGDEREIIIFSLGYDGTVKNFGPVSQFGGENRVNVAVTRSIDKMIIFKSIESSELNIGNSEGAKVLQKFLKHCENIQKKSEMNQIVKSKFDSKFEEDFFNKLSQQLPGDYSLQTQFASIGYKIDLVLGYKKKPILAIELDGEPFHTKPADRKRDIYRQIALENRGWEFVRIWYKEFVLNPNKQIKKILDWIQKYEER